MTFDDRVADLEAHLDHCRQRLTETVVQSSVAETNREAWVEEIATLSDLIPAFEEIQAAINDIVVYLTEAEKKLKIDQQGLADLPEVL